MDRFDFGMSWFPRSLPGRALLVTLLYAGFAFVTLYAPISAHAPFVRLFGTRDAAREALVSFAQLLFWPLCGAVLFGIGQSGYRLLRTLTRRAD